MKIKNNDLKIAVIGARGLIGMNFLHILEQYEIEKSYNNFQLDCFGASDGNQISFGQKRLPIYKLEDFVPEKYDIIFSAVDANLILPFKERIKQSNAIWVDKSWAMRMDEDVPLVVPEINMQELLNKKIVASPNCVTIPVAIFMHALRGFDFEHINITTYQSVSGAGRKAMDAFFREMKASNTKTIKHGMLYEDPMAYNVIPSIGEIDELGNCDEENKIVQELKKILPETKNTLIMATTMRVPTTIGHLISLNFKLSKNVEAKKLISNMEKLGIVYLEKNCTPLMAAYEDLIFACRLRAHAPKFWSVVLVCDNLRKGGALNAWQIIEEMRLLNS